MTADPERLAIVVRLDAPDGAGEPRYALVRTRDDGPLALLDAAAPASGVRASTRWSRTCCGRASASAPRARRWRARSAARAARPSWREGRVGIGWMRAVAVSVDAPLDPGPPLTGVEALPLVEAEAALRDLARPRAAARRRGAAGGLSAAAYRRPARARARGSRLTVGWMSSGDSAGTASSR